MSIVERIIGQLGVGLDDFDPPHPSAEQALVDLLVLTMLVDGTMSTAEQDRIRSHLDAADWPDGVSPFTYFETATPRIRRALADPSELESLLASVTDRLRSDGERQLALTLLHELAGLDHRHDDRETALIDGLRQRFGAV